MQLLRKIERKKWLLDRRQHKWVPEDEFFADPLGDLGTSNGVLSVWRVDHASDEVRVAAAVAAIRDKVLSVDYWLIDEATLVDNNFLLKQCDGQSADPALNKKGHYDIINLTERSLLRLAALFRDKGMSKTCAPTTIIQRLAPGIEDGTISRAQVRLPWLRLMADEGLLPQ